MNPTLDRIYPVSSRLIGRIDPPPEPVDFPRLLETQAHLFPSLPYLAELAALELARHRAAEAQRPFPVPIDRPLLNPTVQVVEVGWTGLAELLQGGTLPPIKGQSLVLLYRIEPQGAIQVRTAEPHDLLALKLVAEDIDSDQAAREADVTIGTIDALISAAVRRGLILVPPSLLVRDQSFLTGPFADPELSRVHTFVLQWHITQTCDLHCRHCYDRSSRPPMELQAAIEVLDQLYAFAKARHVAAQISFSGGNPLLYPSFPTLYREAIDRGFRVAILGNPIDEHTLKRLLAIGRPEFYQVSLEGLREHNDYIRGPGHYDRVFAFLSLLRRYGVYSMVMLTLTRANATELLPLARALRGRTDLFTFNRLAMVGEGAELASVEVEAFPALLREYLAEARENDIVAIKDNLFNLLLNEEQQPLTGGCTGFGCGAAFNFVSLLPDGEVHACRKFPSLIGNIRQQSLAAIYDSGQANAYRSGSRACGDCEFRPVCRGCPAVTHGFGLDVFTELDPYCFKIKK